MTKPHRDSIRDVLAQAWSDHLAVLEQHLPGARAGRDSEELHRFRVALRKTRALLKLFRDTLPQAYGFKEDFKWLAGATGEVRDLDVLCAEARHNASTLGVTAAPVAPIIAALRNERVAAQKELGGALRGRRARNLLESWRQFLVTLTARTDLPAAADVPAWTAINPLIIRQSRRLLQEGVAIDSGTDPHNLHALRIRSKRLRYLLESFDVLVELHGVDPLVGKLRKLQTVLGAHQDAAVAAARWKMLGGHGAMPAGTQALLQKWIEEAKKKQEESRAMFTKALEKFARACECL